MAQTGKALSSRLAEASRRVFGQLSAGLMAAATSEAGGEAQKQLLPTIGTRPTASISRGGKALSSGVAEASPSAFGQLSAGVMAAATSEAGGEAQEELLPTIGTRLTASRSRGEEIGNLGRRLAELSLAACAADEAAQTGKALSSPAEGAFGEVSLGLMAQWASEAGDEPQEELLSIITTPTSSSHAEKDANHKDDIMESEGSLKDLASRVENISTEFDAVKGECRKYLLYHTEDDGSSSTSTYPSDFEDEILSLLAETRRPNFRHMPAEEFSLPEISSLDLPFQFPLNHERSAFISKSSSSSNNSSNSTNSSSSSENQTRLDEDEGEDDDIHSEIGSIGIATEEEEEMLLAEASVCVANDLEALEIIISYDEEEVFSQLEMRTTSRTEGVSREKLLDQQIVLFGKEKATTCSICINDFATTDRCIKLPCKHIFHFQCIIQWLLANKTCPVCWLSLTDLESTLLTPPATPDGTSNVHEALEEVDEPRRGA